MLLLSALLTRPAPPRALVSASAVETAAMTTAEATSLFGRLSENKLYLDKNVGACCHSACSDCEWRDPGGGYRFDTMSAARRKWIPCYVRRDFADERGCHEPLWAQTLFPRSDEPLQRSELSERLEQLEFEMPMGPRGTLKPEASQPSASAVDVFWEWLAGPDAESVTIDAALERLKDMSPASPDDPERLGAIGEGPDSVDWKNFAKALGAEPFARW